MHGVTRIGRLGLAADEVARQLRRLTNVERRHVGAGGQQLGGDVRRRGHDQIIACAHIVAHADGPAAIGFRNRSRFANEHVARPLRQTRFHAFGIEIEALQIEQQVQRRHADDFHSERLHRVQIIERGELGNLGARARMREHADEVVADRAEFHALDEVLGRLGIELFDHRVALERRRNLHGAAIVFERSVARNERVAHPLHIAEQRRRIGHGDHRHGFV